MGAPNDQHRKNRHLKRRLPQGLGDRRPRGPDPRRLRTSAACSIGGSGKKVELFNTSTPDNGSHVPLPFPPQYDLAPHRTRKLRGEAH